MKILTKKAPLQVLPFTARSPTETLNGTGVDGAYVITFEEHCQESKRLLATVMKKVHKWLDEFAGKEPYRMRYRRKRHNEQGIRKAIELFG